MKKVMLLLMLFSLGIHSRSLCQAKNNRVNDSTQTPCCCDQEKSVCIVEGKKVTTTDILYDFKTKDIGNRNEWCKLRKGDFVRVKVLNYNPYLYKIILNQKDSSVATSLSGKLDFFVDPGNIAAIAANIIGGGITSEVSAGIIDNGARNFMLNYDLKKVTRDSMLLDLNITDPEPSYYKSNGKTIKVLPTKDDSIVIARKLMDSTLQLVSFSQMDFFILKNNVGEFGYNIIRKFAVLRKLYPSCNDFSNLFTLGDLANFEQTMIEARESIHVSRDSIAKSFTIYQILLSPYTKLIPGDPVLFIRDSLIKTFYIEMLKSLTKTEENFSYNSQAEIIEKFENVVLNSSCYVSFPIFIGEDVKHIDLEIKPRFDSLGLPAYTSSLIIPFIQRKVWGISSGIYVSGLHNDVFSNRPVFRGNSTGGTDTLYNLVKEENGKVQIGLNALAYAGWKINETNNNPDYITFSFGAGLSFESKFKPRVLLGAGFLTGDKNRLLFTIGIIGGQVNRLSKTYDINANYTTPPKDVMQDVMKLHGFLSINYSFISK